MNLLARGRSIGFPRRPWVMGIVNINDDSFCQDGTLDPAEAIGQAEAQIIAGADVIDIGAESARTNRAAISVDEEVQRLSCFIERWPDLVARWSTPPWDSEQTWPPLLSINTWRSEVVEKILPLGGDLLNDLSALPTPRNAELCAHHGAALVIMHSVGQPKVPHTHVSYENVMGELDRFFDEKLSLAMSAGLKAEHIVLDPGIDFAKQRDDNLRIYRDLERLRRFGRPVLLPVSRKTVIGEVLGQKNALERDAGTMACIATGMRRGTEIFRVHNVVAAARSVKVLWALQSVATPA